MDKNNSSDSGKVLSPNKSDTFEKDIEMLKYFQEEFIYRHKHFWDIIVKSFVLTVVITILPITSEVLGVALADIPRKASLCFPVLGFIIALLSFFILQSESKRMKAVNETKYRINNRMSAEYRYIFFNKFNKDVRKGNSDKKKWMSFQLPWMVFVTEFIIIVCVAGFLLWLMQPPAVS